MNDSRNSKSRAPPSAKISAAWQPSPRKLDAALERNIEAVRTDFGPLKNLHFAHQHAAGLLATSARLDEASPVQCIRRVGYPAESYRIRKLSLTVTGESSNAVYGEITPSSGSSVSQTFSVLAMSMELKFEESTFGQDPPSMG